MQPDPYLDRIVSVLADTPGLDAIVLGGSRARGTAHETSDYDIGLYYSSARPLDIDRLRESLRTLVDNPDAIEMTPIGDWGRWIVGGGWLSIQGRKVDLLYRDIDAVGQVIADCRTGNISMHYQPGHPHGFCSAIWAGEVALCKVLHDPRAKLAALKAGALPYPGPLREALIRRFQWEVLFSLENAELAIARGEQTYVAGCVYRALSCVAQVLFALNESYLINEKGALQEASRFALTIPELMPGVSDIWQNSGTKQFRPALARLHAVERELTALVEQTSRGLSR